MDSSEFPSISTPLASTKTEGKPGSTDNDRIIAKILQEEFDFEYEVTKRAMTSSSSGGSANGNGGDFNFQTLLPKIGSFLSLNEYNSNIRIKSSNIPKCFTFYSESIEQIVDKESDCNNLQKNAEDDTENDPTLNDKCPIEINQDMDYESFVTFLNSESELMSFNQSLRRFIQEFVALEIDMLDQIQVLNEFLDYAESLANKLPIHPHESLTFFKAMTERVVMNKVYYRIFELELDRERNESLSESIKRHSWISLGHLDLPEQYSIHEPLMAKAIDSLIRIDLLKSPADKLAALADASKAAFQIITADPDKRTRGAATDDFLPLLIYLILKAQPSRLYSNAQYIARFKRKESSEDRYFFTTLLAAISFIQNLTFKSLTITKEEYAKQTDPQEEPLFEIEGIKIKNIFKRPFNSVSKWFEKEFNSKPPETIEMKERQQLAMAIELSLQEGNKPQK